MFFYGVDPLAHQEVGMGGRRLSSIVPPTFPRRLLDAFFDAESNIRLRDNVARLVSEPNGDFIYEIDASGYRQGELRVEVDGNVITIQAEHRENNGEETVERSFKRTLRIPEGLKREQIKCRLDEQGRIKIVGTKVATDQGRRRSIPIAFKPSPKSNTANTSQQGKMQSIQVDSG